MNYFYKHQRERTSLALTAALSLALSFLPLITKAATVDHVVIREIQIAGATALDEFVELYNPTSNSINLSGWRLAKRTSTGTQSNLLTTFPDVALPAGHHFLVTHPTGYTGEIMADTVYSTSGSLAENNSVILFSDSGTTIVDLVGWGTATSFETTATTNPSAGESLGRLMVDGIIIDENNNEADFTISTAPTPTNLTTAPPAPTPDPTPTPDPEPTPDPTPTPAPTYTTSDVLINEFVSAPATGDEWIELLNMTASGIDLANWQIIDGTNHVLNLSGNLEANGYIVVNRASGYLNNDGDRIELRAPNQTVIDDVTYGDWDDGNVLDNAPAPDASSSSDRYPDPVDTNVDSADFIITTSLTAGVRNAITLPTPTPPPDPMPTPDPTPTPPPAPAPDLTTLRFSEIFPNPKGTDAAEYIELLNIGSTTIDLNGWKIHSGDYLTVLNFSPSTSLGASGYLRLTKSQTGIALRNGGGQLLALTPPSSSTPVDTVIVSSKPPEGSSYAKFNDAWQWTTTPTPGAANIMTLTTNVPRLNLEVSPPQPTTQKNSSDNGLVKGALTKAPFTTSSSLIINEIFPAPDNQDTEWVEIFNSSQDLINLTGWQLADADDHQLTLTSDFTVASGDFLVLNLEDSDVTLNNTADSIFLIDANGVTLDSVDYTRAKRGQSYARLDETFVWTKIITPGEPNDVPNIATTSALVKTRDSATNIITIVGTVAADFNTAEPNAMYLNNVMDHEPPVFKIKSTTAQDSEWEVGQILQLTASLSRASIIPTASISAVDDVEILGTDEKFSPLSVEEINISEDVGKLISFAATVTRKTTTGYVAELPSGQTISVRSPANLTLPVVAKGASLKITGILMRSGSSPRLLLRSIDDFEFVEAITVASTDSVKARQDKFLGWPPEFNHILIALAALCSATTYWLIRRRQQATTLPEMDEEII